MLKGLYAITDAVLIPPRQFATAIRAALDGGVSVIQYRDKSANTSLRIEQATLLCRLCREYDVPCLINDDVALAAKTGADGVHIGRDDANIRQARMILGDKTIIGVSCYNDLESARQAQRLGADYVAFGRFFSSPTKPDAAPASLDVLQQAHETLDIPVCAIGGITIDNAPPLLTAGADMLAVISGVFGASDVRFAAAQYTGLFD